MAKEKYVTKKAFEKNDKAVWDNLFILFFAGIFLSIVFSLLTVAIYHDIYHAPDCNDETWTEVITVKEDMKNDVVYVQNAPSDNIIEVTCEDGIDIRKSGTGLVLITSSIQHVGKTCIITRAEEVCE